ncbi:MAG TPA: hypothetical protein ENI34_05170 [candidate division WOR-3 bacterium]|uniref:Uncharacterized protein n=1 Tax=candidate division WOR-3 bacterium TaxID=2052148 RepID=A0A9C9K089_UNCW3|nr:hypothetical protein [candidate division WOR-3 bacterium]
MKKVLTYLLIVLLFGAIFGLSLQNFNTNIKEDAPVISSFIDYLMPAPAYADTNDTTGIKLPPPPPPPIDG